MLQCDETNSRDKYKIQKQPREGRGWLWVLWRCVQEGLLVQGWLPSGGVAWATFWKTKMIKTDLSLWQLQHFTDKANYSAILPPFPFNNFWLELCREGVSDRGASRCLWGLTVASGKQPIILYQWVSFHSHSPPLCSAPFVLPFLFFLWLNLFTTQKRTGKE